ncbi:hypothetical protein V7S43_005301 [Phytophthora oleae]|uniref:C2 domain-containing protein n=1 Tax=Phytophthora oleae TaxID=2107226 RepID=A0ABD3FU86_9STRA
MLPIVSHCLEPPSKNPPKRQSQDPALGGKTIRLEAPDELDSDWDGPVYATLSKETKLLQPTDNGPFVAEDDGVRRPAWRATLTILRHDQRRGDLSNALQEHVDVQYWIPHWRLTFPSYDLTGELQKRPLLSLFRFVRISEFFVASPDCDVKLARHVPDGSLCGQVVAYSPASSLSLVDDIDIQLEPGSGFICYVAIRHFVSEPRQIVVVPLDDVRVNHISRAEYVLEFSHGQPIPSSPGEFAAMWAKIPALDPADGSAVMQHIATAFTAPGANSSTVLDLCSGRVAFITPRGEKTSATATNFVLDAKRMSTMAAVQEDDSHSELPLLSAEETRLTPIDEFSLPTRPSRPYPPGETPRIAAASSGPGPVASVIPPHPDSQLVRVLIDQQRASMEATQAMLRQLTDLTSAVLQPATPPLPPLLVTAPAAGDGARTNSLVSRVQDPEPPAQRHGLDALGAEAHRPGGYDRHRSRSSRQPSRRRDSRSRLPRQAPGRRFPSRSRSRSRQRRGSQRSRSRSPSRRSEPRWSRSRSRAHSSPSYRPSGASAFRPTENEARVHDVAHVGPSGKKAFNRFVL